LGRLRAGKVLTPHLSGRYLRVRMSHHGVEDERPVHCLVLEAFVGPRPQGLVGCHYDGDVWNNHLSNLRWDTQAANIQDAIRHGTAVLEKNFKGATGSRHADGRVSEKAQRYLTRPKRSPDDERRARAVIQARSRAKRKALAIAVAWTDTQQPRESPGK
ncbi:MAG TPA: HNH endonuclease, partial [Steroidobacteraceae bacterium]|nr:HNH endonuclease [Steroidobacteraceae bacterium]